MPTAPLSSGHAHATPVHAGDKSDGNTIESLSYPPYDPADIISGSGSSYGIDYSNTGAHSKFGSLTESGDDDYMQSRSETHTDTCSAQVVSPLSKPQDVPMDQISDMSARDIVPTKLIQVYGKAFLVPIHEKDAETIRQLARMGSNACDIHISVEHMAPDELESFLNHIDPPEKKENQGTRENPEPALTPKHVYKTSCDTYRVQLSKGSRLFPNKKFSRNARTEIDALWLCECALVLIDQPETFRDLLRNGNFQYLLQKEIISSADDFAAQLQRSVKELGNRKKLKAHEIDQITSTLKCILPSYPNSQDSHESTGYATGVERNLAERTRRSFSAIMCEQWGGVGGGDVDRRKRRKLPRATVEDYRQQCTQHFSPPMNYASHCLPVQQHQHHVDYSHEHQGDNMVFSLPLATLYHAPQQQHDNMYFQHINQSQHHQDHLQYQMQQQSRPDPSSHNPYVYLHKNP
mmetsp:Transcript_20094/g.28881  ORF Transcript_20094/g.28881 Transcript_20094/m.28881 type:complete len:463 (+) Transcript_20094:73-1461(+)|eukprot:CAMPEP_0185039884 /NCGR_PEP_ID=MMETSP1103-20130426/37263_1 /TAXON_ID=36769 /ORGANISM="Paraphysomonas bandaiensis, Strain Caron Lab Isolate" /LENGTH=462 /DNA_ID=CAMNT_0027578951 /DNA_START=16 /DNA_END=1404 /DNA_ORIENTATION=+